MQFEDAVEIILMLEGGYVNDPRDPGGETKFGISKRAYPDLDIKTLTREQAKDIYYQDYWRAVECDYLPEELRLIAFDSAVQHGVAVAEAMIEKAKRSPDPLLSLILTRHAKYFSLSNFEIFGKGWTKRLLTVARYS